MYKPCRWMIHCLVWGIIKEIKTIDFQDIFFFLNIFCVRLVESPDMEPTKPNCVMNSEITNFRKNRG